MGGGGGGCRSGTPGSSPWICQWQHRSSSNYFQSKRIIKRTIYLFSRELKLQNVSLKLYVLEGILAPFRQKRLKSPLHFPFKLLTYVINVFIHHLINRMSY